MYNLKVFLMMLRLNVKNKMVYKSAYFIALFFQFTGYIIQIVTTWILISGFNSLGSWTANEVVFIYSMQIITYGIAGIFFANISADLPKLIKNGELDIFMTKPISTFQYLVNSNINLGYLAHISVGTICILFSLIQLNIVFSVALIIKLLLFVLCGAVITSAVMLITTLPSTYFLGDSSWWGIAYNLRNYNNYPLSIFNTVIQSFFTFILPFAFVAYYPAIYVFDKPEGLILKEYILIYDIILCGILIFITRKTWLYFMGKYESAGN